ncbi:MAG: fructose-specific PTS transporter subunit EIIC [Erysipelotrichaceae bacterium]|nr:fructose-specific PTS transporter subunit EIIC [Erysipelotrichaceae bacterium]
MKITDLLSKESILLNEPVSSKDECLKKMVDLMEASGKISDKKLYLDAVYAREAEGTTGVGNGIAIPHGRCSGVKEAGLAAMTIRNGVDYDALDGNPVEVVFLIAAPESSGTVHLEILSKLAQMLMDEKFVDLLKSAYTAEAFLNIIDKAESEKDAAVKKDVSDHNTLSSHLILAVTACPTGIAHTYMAAEAIEKAAKAKGYQVKVETRGSGGAKNILSEEEIEKADGIIVAADTNVPMDRFDGKRVIECQVSKGINKADELIETVVHGDVPRYKASGKKETAEKDSSGHTIYKHLMNGVSHMLPFVVGGGILIALAFLIDGLAFDINSLSAADRANFGVLTPLSAFLKGKVGGVAFGFMLPVLAGFIAMSIADRPGLAVGIVGGSIAANGASGFLGAIAAGFIGGYAVNYLKKLSDKIIPDSLDGIKPVLIYPLFGLLIVGLVMVFAIEPVVGAINTWMNSALASLSGANVILLGMIVAGMMAIDMGGPFNKAAYVFGVASIASGNYNIMAAVMIGGMVPPCAIALATLLFKNKFTENERKSGPTNFIMGLAFITEGAIPFAAADPLRVIPSCVVGSAVAGALSMAFNCTLMAPHGGIFVFPVVGNWLMYLVALVAGTIVGAILLGVLKKNID